jgi:hypothetical protein
MIVSEFMRTFVIPDSGPGILGGVPRRRRLRRRGLAHARRLGSAGLALAHRGGRSFRRRYLNMSRLRELRRPPDVQGPEVEGAQPAARAAAG